VGLFPEDACGPFEIEVLTGHLRLTVEVGQSVLETLRRHGIEVPSSCEEGVCGTCLTRVLSGVVDHRDAVLSEGSTRLMWDGIDQPLPDGVISSYDDVNSILLAGRADLCLLGRAHLYDPNWTLHAAAGQSYTGPGAEWPLPWRAGSRPPQTGRIEGPKPRLDLIRARQTGTAHRRWQPAQTAPDPR